MSQLRDKYQADADTMASKSRFGYFSLPPSHTAAVPPHDQGPHPRGEDGKPQVEQPNIFPGPNRSGCMRKNYFSYVPSPFHGSVYQDPAAQERKSSLQKSQTGEGKEVYKPARLNKTLIKSAYEYMSPYDPKASRKSLRDADGKVIIQNPNVQTSLQSKIHYQSDKKFKYIEEPPADKVRHVAESDDKSQEPFRAGRPKRSMFSSDHQTFYDTNISRSEPKASVKKVASHEGPFKPSCASKNRRFTPVVYKEEGEGRTLKKVKNENARDAFKLTKVERHSKPTPSIAYSKINLRVR